MFVCGPVNIKKTLCATIESFFASHFTSTILNTFLMKTVLHSTPYLLCSSGKEAVSEQQNHDKHGGHHFYMFCIEDVSHIVFVQTGQHIYFLLFVIV